jgi:hypothetical protein
MGMVFEGAGPSVKNAQGAESATEVLGVPGKRLKRLKCGAYQSRVQDALV